MDKRTVLSDWHEKHGARMVGFGGFLMPLFYQSIIHEHHAVRTHAGLFDVCHMGELELKGTDALKVLNRLLTNKYDDLAVGAARYGVLVKEDGTAVDDCLVYCLGDNHYWIVTNASNTEKDEAYLRSQLDGNATLVNLSDSIGLVALQGPASVEILSKHFSDAGDIPYYHFREYTLNGKACIVSRTGYTGEDGYEVYCASEDTELLWENLLKADEQLIPCGLGCRDTLRLEAAMPLYGHELNESITALEAGLSPFVKLDKEDFIAQDALSTPPLRRRIGLKLIDRGIAREMDEVYLNDELVGVVTSGTRSPSLNESIALALVKQEVFKEKEFTVNVRGKKLRAEKVKLPFYKR